MRRQIRRRQHDMPELNLASLPDLIFTVLFFFMIVTHMRDVDLKVKYQVPEGTEIEKLSHKQATTYIYIGRPIDGSTDSVRIQLNDRYATVDEIAAWVKAERSRMPSDVAEMMTVSIKADRDVPMGIISDVKQALRKAYALEVNYSARHESDGKEAVAGSPKKNN